MVEQGPGEEKPLQSGSSVYRRVGHKGADAITQGNTLESFDAAVKHGVDMIEFDVLRDREGRFVIAHDSQRRASRRPLDLTEVLDAFLEPPLDQVEIDCDLKLPGREAELAGALAGRGLVERAMVSTMEISSLAEAAPAGARPAPGLDLSQDPARLDPARLGRARRSPPGWRRCAAASRRPCCEQAPELDVDAVWAYHQIVTPKLVDAAEEAGSS